MQPRIYTYKITFEEVPYYYYGSHKEKKYNEYYMGSPVTHKLMWDFYTPKKQILEIFNSREDANIIENRLIKPILNDKWCLNENCGAETLVLEPRLSMNAATILSANITGANAASNVSVNAFGVEII